MADTAEMACDDLRQGKTGILEVAQGFELGINHGLQYPNCTSRECSPMQGLSDNGIPIKFETSMTSFQHIRFVFQTKWLRRMAVKHIPAMVE